MKIVVQRVSEASVSVEKSQIGSINNGLLILLGVHEHDTEEKVEWICNKIVNMRIFDDEEGVMNYSARDIKGDLLIVPQFTLYGNAEKGNRPSYSEAARPGKAKKLYRKVIDYMKENYDLKVEEGEFGAYMDVQLHNDGPVTIILEK